MSAASLKIPGAVAGVQRAGPTLVVFGLLFFLMFYPLGRLLWQTFWSPGEGLTLDAYREAFSSATAVSAIWGSAFLTLASLLLAVPLAVALAWITSSTDAPLARRLALLPLISLAVPPLVGSIGWLVLLAPRAGLVNILLRNLLDLGTDTGPLDAFSVPVLVLVMALYVVPYIYGPVYSAFLQLDASLQEAAQAAGAGFFAVAKSIVLPVLRPAILAGTLIGGVTAASTFVIPLILASGTGVRVIPTLIYQLVNQEGRAAPATALSSLLSVFTIVGLFLYMRAIGQSSFVTVGGKGVRAKRVHLGPWQWSATVLLLTFLALAIGLPLLALLYVSLIGFWSAEAFQQSLSLIQYVTLPSRPFVLPSLFNSIWLAAAGATLAVAIGLVVAYVQLRNPTNVNRALSLTATLPLGIPAIVLGLAVLFAYTGYPLPLYGTPSILILAYCLHMLPVGSRYAEAGLRQIAPELEEAGRVFGGSPFTVFARIILPLVREPVLAAWTISFIILFRDLPISILMYTASTIVSSVSLLNIFEQGSLPATAAFSIVITLISCLAVWTVIKLSRTTVT